MVKLKQKQKKLFECDTFAEHSHCPERGFIEVQEGDDL